MNGLGDGFCQKIFDSNASIQHSVGQPLVKAGSCLKDMFDSVAISMHLHVRDAICSTEGDAQKSFVDAPEIMVDSLGLIAGHSKHGDSNSSKSSFAPSVNPVYRLRKTGAASNKESVLMGDTP